MCDLQSISCSWYPRTITNLFSAAVDDMHREVNGSREISTQEIRNWTKNTVFRIVDCTLTYLDFHSKLMDTGVFVRLGLSEWVIFGHPGEHIMGEFLA